jgi:hypothetical protein
MIIERGGSLLGMMLMQLSGRYISIIKLCSRFFNSTGKYKLVILPDEQKMNHTYFIERVLRPLPKFCYPQGRGPHERRIVLYFYRPPVHNSEGVQESLANFNSEA